VEHNGAEPPGRLATLLRGYRRAAGLTQRDLATRAGISLGVLEDLEQGRTRSPRAGALSRLATALRLGPGERAALTGAAAGRPPPAAPAGPGPHGRATRIEVLGPLRVWRDGRLLPTGPARSRAVLGLLALHADTGLSRTALVDALWGDAPPPSAVAMIQAHVSRIRRLLGPEPGGRARLSWDGSGYRLSLAGIGLDAAESGALAARARQAAAAGDAAAAGALYQQALRLWRGQPLADVRALHDHPAITGLTRWRDAVVIEYADAAANAGHFDGVLGHLEALAARDPLDERAHARLMRVLAATGRQAAALRVYTELAARLDAELGVRPGPELAAAHLEVLRQQVRPGAAGPVVTGRALPRQLPADVRGFAGRTAEQAALTRLLDLSAAPGGTVVISAIGGTAGVGKTALAVHWAHQVAGRFPDGQLHVNLRGFGPASAAMTPEAAIRLLLDGLGVAPERVPAGLDAQAALYRSLLAGRRMLVVADNARSADQVRPLLPGAPGCLVLVTSRNELTGLAASHGARLLTLDVLTGAEASELLDRRLGRDRGAAEPAAAAELAGLCAGLPLALSVAAARAAARPDLPLAELAGELRGARARLDGLRTADVATDVRTVFSWSYQQLSEPAARLFRLLGVHPGPDITGPAAASLAALPPGAAGPALAELVSAHLIAEHAPGRYAFHDLLRAYAAEQAHARDGAAARAAARRAADHYLHTAFAAARLVNPYRDPVALGPAQPGISPEEITTLDQALAWFTAEWRVLLGVIGLAASEEIPGHAWRLFWALATFLHRNGYLREMLAAGDSALAAARTAGDLAGQAAVHRHLGQAQTALGGHAQAGQHLNAALALYQRLGQDMAAARVHLALADLYDGQRRYGAALSHGERGLRLYRALGYRPGEALALNAVGWTLAQDGRYAEALEYCAQARDMQGVLRADAVARASTLDSLGYIHSQLGDHAKAVSCYQQAIGLLAGGQNVRLRAEMLAHLGDAHQAAGDPAAARRAWHQALAVFDQLSHPDAGGLRSRLSGSAGDTAGPAGAVRPG
jgi:DNA-binding SARP family transcriptional activator/Tfp pilus assembly protein PilF/DNA-binding XRE family transcriptional regulator